MALPRHLLQGSVEHLVGLDTDENDAGEGANVADPAWRRRRVRYALGNGKILPAYMVKGSLEQLQVLCEDDDASETASLAAASVSDVGAGGSDRSSVLGNGSDRSSVLGNDGSSTRSRTSSVTTLPSATAAPVPPPKPAMTTAPAPAPPKMPLASHSSPALMVSPAVKEMAKVTPSAAPPVALALAVSGGSCSALGSDAPATIPATTTTTTTKKRRPSKGSSVLHMLFHLGEAGGAPAASPLAPMTINPVAVAGTPTSGAATPASETADGADPTSRASSPSLPNKRANTVGTFLAKLTRRRSNSSVDTMAASRQSLSTIAEDSSEGA
jgi:hypothetical protein